ncbi:Uncharacterised protein [Serratia fonticola]|uniref:Cellulose synthase operon protein C n=1 Tax=Serratia fonticola TaxID=47917 RepID=A0A4U9WCN7_SERFO|nr:Uncharacterised protein [Serratia fonticola]
MSALADDNNPALKALFQQAAYWHDKSHDELAQGALQKVLLIDENNAEAMYLLSLYAMQGGDKAKAEIWRKKLSAVAPNESSSPGIEQHRKRLRRSPRICWRRPGSWRAKGEFCPGGCGLSDGVQRQDTDR